VSARTSASPDTFTVNGRNDGELDQSAIARPSGPSGPKSTFSGPKAARLAASPLVQIVAVDRAAMAVAVEAVPVVAVEAVASWKGSAAPRGPARMPSGISNTVGPYVDDVHEEAACLS
jgi:hypothetical protein